MSQEINEHVGAVEHLYRPLILGARLNGGQRLWAQFEQAVSAYRARGRGQFGAIYERVNEFAMAKFLLTDPRIPEAEIQYEPEIITNGPRFDFVVPQYEGAKLYVGVKTVHPQSADTEGNWQKAERRRANLTPQNHYVVAKEWMGATIFGNSFSARGSFLAYTLEIEAKLAQTCVVAPGRCVLVFCGTGFPWHLSELEDFADFYRTGRHRADDPFATMERHHMTEQQISLRRNVEAFGAMMRKHDQTEPEEWVYPVRGPAWPAPAVNATGAHQP